MSKVIIIGAGIAGMTAAMELQKKGHSIIIYEATSHIGGRCYSYFDKKLNTEIDNGQHLFSSAYSTFFDLMKWLKNENLFSEKNNIKVDFVDENNILEHRHYSFDCTKYKGTLGFIYGLFKINSISLADKIRTIRLLKSVLINNFSKQDISVLQLLNRYKISQNAIKKFWNPMVVSMLNAPITEASAFLFINVLRKLIFEKNDFMNLLYSKVPLSQLFNGFECQLAAANNKLYFNTFVKELLIENNKCIGIITDSGEKIYSNYVISAVPFNIVNKFNIENYNENYNGNYNFSFNQSAIISIYLSLNKQIHDKPYVAYIDTNIEWIFNLNMLYDIKNTNTYKYFITISNADKLVNIRENEILTLIKLELKKIAEITENNILDYRILKSRNATPLITYCNNLLRPAIKTDIKNFFLAGDWVNTNLPATIESAALSGKIAANYIS